ncbi:hypothetical protein, partial [Peptoniphilus indolicus]
LLLVLLILLPSFAMAKEYDMKAIEDEIKATIDFSDRELYGTEYSLRSAGSPEDFAVYHRKDPKLSMADDAFDKSKSKVIDNGDSYTFIFYLQPVKKWYPFKYYEADCTEIKFMTPTGEKEAEYTVKELEVDGKTKKKAINSDKLVPYGFEITISKDYLEVEEDEDYGFPHFYRIKFETNLEDSGALGVIGDKMMNRNARLYVK